MAKSSEQIAADRKANYAANPEKFRELTRLWREKNRKRHVEQTTRWRLENPLEFRLLTSVINARRRAGKAKPSWYDDAPIREFYRNVPEGHEVDHIIPLKGCTLEGYMISGLHVHWNLQYLTISDNKRKWRKMREEDGLADLSRLR